ncbi:MAG: ATP-binding protein [Paludibacteraceae bacterium]|nr:ATP-binding protein [Paludibacteraceae bacterium]
MQRLIEAGEGLHQDFKYKVADAPKLARSISAFANTEGGRLLVGIRDDGSISGVRSEEEIYMLQAAAQRYCTPRMEIDFQSIRTQGRTIVIATIGRATHRPVRAIDETGKRTAYLRIKDENIIASPVHIAMWKQEQCSTVITNYGADEACLIEQLAQHPHCHLNTLIKLTHIGRRQVISTLARLIRYELAECLLIDHQFCFSLR